MRCMGFRHAAYDSPWWAFPSSRPGRYHRAGKDTVQYLCLHPLGPAAEMLRHNVGPDGNADEVRLNLWAATLDLDDVLHVDFGDASKYGCAPEQLVGDNYGPTQLLADHVRASGAKAMVVPSAALPGTHNLIIFGIRVLQPYLWKPLTVEEVPTGHLSDSARAAAEVAPSVRWFGTQHSALEQWKASGAYALFQDPPAVCW